MHALHVASALQHADAGRAGPPGGGEEEDEQLDLGTAELPAQERWQGPLRSAFGWHAVQLTERQAATTLSFEQVQEKVALDWKQQQRRAANEAYLQSLLASYEIELPPGEASTAEP